MGVWTTGPRARAVAFKHRPEYQQILADLRDEDIGASPYAIADYRVSEALGGEDGLKEFRQRLYVGGMKLVLDFVPNHLGLDHVWIKERPDLFVQSQAESAGTFLEQTKLGPRWLAYGKDPYFPPWTDTIQLDYRSGETRREMIGILESIAERCDGVRCDMAMLLLNDFFAKTWENFPVPNHESRVTDAEFWSDAIRAIKGKHDDFLFLAEAYWGLEARLQELGFDYAYDKALLDRLVARDNKAAQQHVLETPEMAVGAHFLENHDERRIASILTAAEHRAAALLILGLPGTRFLHEGQLTGARVKQPVQLLRRPFETPNPDIQRFYEELLGVLKTTAVGRGHGELLRPREAWSGNPTAQNIILVQWQNAESEFDLVTVNLATHPSQCYAPLDIPNSSVHKWLLKDLLGDQQFVKDSAELKGDCLYLDLPAHAAQLFHFEPAKS
jgi:hypothetical protein